MRTTEGTPAPIPLGLGQGQANLSQVPSAPRATDPTAGDQFRAALGRGAATVLSGLEAAAPFVPGGVSTPLAVRAAAAGATDPGAVPGVSSDGGVTLGAVGGEGDQAFALLALQQRIGDEQQRFMTISSVMKSRHETAKTVIGNFR